MKTTKKLAYFCVAVLSDVFCLTSCTSEEVNPNYDAERGVVKTEFTISIPAKPSGTRMTAATVQAEGQDFRGIEGIKLYSFKSKVAGITEGTALPSIIDLAGGSVSTLGASGTANNTIASSGALFANNNAHLYQDVEVPIGTQAFMIYGVAMPSKVNPTTPTTDDEFTALANNGTLTDNLSSAATLDAITFSPVPIYANSEIDASGNGPKIADYLTSIVQATGWSASDNVVLQTLYQNFITMRAGSWASVKGAVQQLYTSIYSRTDAVSTAIKTAILADANVKDEAGGSADGKLEFTDPAYGNYPADIHLPDGAAYVKWNGSAFQAINYQSDAGYIPIVLPSGTSLAGYYSRTGDEGSYTYTAITTGTADGTTTYYRKYDNTGLDVPNLNRYVYPAPLYYRALSNIRTANASKKDVYSSASTWAGVLTGEGGYGAEVVGTNDIVKATTRSIAIVDQVQYAVGRLDANVHTQSSATTLKDYENKDIPIKSGDTYYFPITGILIGGQKAVDYKFEQKDGGDAYTIYDNAISGIYLKETESNDKTHTLVFETKDATEPNAPNCVTKISVEFQNNSGKLFVGKDGEIIYPGSKFYLVGTFDPFLNESYKYVGTNNPIKRTFVQDYVTTANLVIASLKNAYNTVPDLRAPQLELGLSVDITWQTGITQTVIIQ